MSRAGNWKTDGYLGLTVATVPFLLGGFDLLRSLERGPDDLDVRACDRTPSDSAVVTATEDPLRILGPNAAVRAYVVAFLERAHAEGVKSRLRSSVRVRRSATRGRGRVSKRALGHQAIAQ